MNQNLSVKNQHNQLWLDIDQNVKLIALFWVLDCNWYHCVRCFNYLGFKNCSDPGMPGGFFHPSSHCDSIIPYGYCKQCVEVLKLTVDKDGSIENSTSCPVCWYFQVKENPDYKSEPPILPEQWQLISVHQIIESHGDVKLKPQPDPPKNNVGWFLLSSASSIVSGLFKPIRHVLTSLFVPKNHVNQLQALT